MPAMIIMGFLVIMFPIMLPRCIQKVILYLIIIYKYTYHLSTEKML